MKQSQLSIMIITALIILNVLGIITIMGNITDLTPYNFVVYKNECKNITNYYDTPQLCKGIICPFNTTNQCINCPNIKEVIVEKDCKKVEVDKIQYLCNEGNCFMDADYLTQNWLDENCVCIKGVDYRCINEYKCGENYYVEVIL